MPQSTRLRSADYEEMLALMGELGELAIVDLTGAINHLVVSVGERLHAACSVLCLDYPQGFTPTEGPTLWQSTHLALTGLDEQQLRYWRQSFIEHDRQFEHPLFLTGVAQAGSQRAISREMLIADSDWYSHPFVDDCLRQVGFDDTLSSTTPLEGNREIVLAACRPWEDRRFSPADLSWLETLDQSLAWLYRLFLNHADNAGASSAASPPAPSAPLAPRLAETLNLLLGGGSEKEIAKTMGIAPRTAHKYVERVYQAFGVHSRAELMARWISYDISGA